MDVFKQNRKFMHCPKFGDIMEESDQKKEIPHPPHSHPVKGELVALPDFGDVVKNDSYVNLLDIRRSERVFEDKAMTRQEFAFMLWSAQGIQDFRGEAKVSTLRPVPSGGARHPFELYAVVKNVEGLKPGIYRYAPLLNVGEKKVQVEFLGNFDNHDERIAEAMADQKWTAKAQVVLILTCVPYRAEWRYREAAHRVVLIDLGHVGQNIMLSAAALGLGSCCIAAYNQEACDKILNVDGDTEYTVYAVAVGNVK